MLNCDSITNRIFTCLICLTVAVLFTGCGGGVSYDTGQVTGTVTLDGSPLAGATVVFSPEGGAPSSGLTDSSGKYELRYSRSTMGAEPGKHSVSITSFNSGDPEGEPPVPAVPEKVPTKYNSETELSEEVKNGPNTIDFDLKTEGGKVVQPSDDE